MVLLDVLDRLRGDMGIQLHIAHLDHALRRESPADREFVAAQARRRGLPCASERRDVAAAAGGRSLEDAGRLVRYAFLDEVAQAVGASHIALGHHADDQAETVLLNLLRGAGVPGTAGIADPVRRPLLALRRTETRGLCETLDLQVVDDPSNADPRFTRNRIRHEVLPLLADVAGRDPVPLLARHATLAGEATGLLANLVTDVDPTDVKSVVDLPDDLVRLAVRRWLIGQVPGPPPDQASVDRVLDVVRGRAVATEVAGGHRVYRSAGFLRFESR